MHNIIPNISYIYKYKYIDKVTCTHSRSEEDVHLYIYIHIERERDGQSIPWYNMYNGAFLVAMNGSYIDIKRLNNHYIILIMVIYYIMAAIIYIYHIYIDTLGELAFHGPWKIR